MAAVHETYAAALQHGRADLPDGTRLVGVVRRPMGWFHGVVDENVPALGPPGDLLDAVKDRQAELEDSGVRDVAAIRQAWDDADFAAGYRVYLDEDPEAAAALEALAGRVEDGEDVALVCYESPEKPCHRHLLRERLAERVDA